MIRKFVGSANRENLEIIDLCGLVINNRTSCFYPKTWSFARKSAFRNQFYYSPSVKRNL